MEQSKIMVFPEGEEVAIEGFVTGITKYKKIEDKIESLSNFPSENPMPVMRFSKDGFILYANNASRPLLKKWNCKIGSPVPTELNQRIKETVDLKISQKIRSESGREDIFIKYIVSKK